MLLDVAPDQTVEHRPIILGQRPALDQDLGHRARPFLRPALKGGDQVGLLDQAVLQGEDAEEQVPVGFDCGHGMGLRWGCRSA